MEEQSMQLLHTGNWQDEITSFYSIIIPSVLRERKLALPDNFVSAHGDGLPDTLRLVLPTGASWYIGLKKSGSLLQLHDGWGKFMEHHSIRLGYFLLFKYKGKSDFGVHIFDMTAIEIQYPLGSNDSTRTIHTNDVADCEERFLYDAEVKEEEEEAAEEGGEEEEEEEDYASHSQIMLLKREAVNEPSSQNSPRKIHKVIPSHARGKCSPENARAKPLTSVPPSNGLGQKTSSICEGGFRYDAEVKEEEEEKDDEEEDCASHSQIRLLKRKAVKKSSSQNSPRKIHKVIPSHARGKCSPQNARAKPLTSVPPSNGLGQKTSSVCEGGFRYDAEVKEEEEEEEKDDEEEDYASHSQIRLLKRKAVKKSSSQNSGRKIHKGIPSHARGKFYQQNARAKPLTSVPSNGLGQKNLFKWKCKTIFQESFRNQTCSGHNGRQGPLCSDDV